MGRLNKRKLQSRNAGQAGTQAAKRKRLQLQSPSPRSVSPAFSCSSSRSVSPELIQLSDIDDILDTPAPAPKTISQPKAGWKIAEKKLPGVCASQYKQKRYYHREKVRNAIAEGKVLKEKGGTLDGWVTVTATATSSTPSATPTQACASRSGSPTVIIEDDPDSDTLSFIQTEIAALEQWVKKNKPAEQQAKRIQALLDLFQFECHNIETNGSNHRLRIKNSQNVAIIHKRKDKWAESLRFWRKQWVESQIPPPNLNKSRDMSWKSLFNDEGVSI